MDFIRRSLIWVLIGLAVLTAIAAGVGATMEANHLAMREAVYPHSPEELWQVISRFDLTPEWRSEVDDIEIQSGDPIRFIEMNADGLTSLQVEEQEIGKRMVLATADPDMPFSGKWTFELTPVEEGTRLRITDNGTISNPLYRLVARTFHEPNEMADLYLTDLGKHLDVEVVPRDAQD
ncbi:MAG: SRPBCC family protein [Myxococcota bacterium]